MWTRQWNAKPKRRRAEAFCVGEYLLALAGAKYAKRLPLRSLFAFGADNGTRTRGLDLGKVALYQLSYVRNATGEPVSWAIQDSNL